MQRLVRFLLLALVVLASPLRAAEIQVLSAGALEPGLEPAVQAFRSASSQAVRITYATAPRIRELLADGEVPNLLIAPQALIDGLRHDGKLAGRPMTLGRIGVGMMVRPDVTMPAVPDAEALRRAMLQAQFLVFNRASTGMYLDRLLERLDLTAAVAAKTLRYPTGADVMDHLLRGSGQELGFGPISEIRMVRELRYVGPLPPEVQNYTTYRAALLPGAPVAAAALLRWLSGAEARAALDAAGIEAAPH